MTSPRAVLLALMALAACRRTPATPRAAPSAEVDESDEGPAPRADAGAPVPTCRRLDARWLTSPPTGGDAGSSGVASVQALQAWVSPAGVWTVAWADGRSGRAVVLRDGAAATSVALGAGERSDPALTVAPDGTPVVSWVRDAMSGRVHEVRGGSGYTRGCELAETRDEGLSLAAVATRRGTVVAWDDDGPLPAAGSVKVQLVPWPGAGAPTCPLARQLSPPEQDASDPILAPTSWGAVAVWLTARDVEAVESNDTSTDLWARAVSAEGVPRGDAIRLTRDSGHRYGLAARVGGDGALWVAYRSAGESDSEARGDGGDVAVQRVLVDELAGVTRAEEPVTVTDDDANPTGTPTLLPPLPSRGAVAPVEAWWLERRHEGVVTMHRALDAASLRATPRAPARREAVMNGMLPTRVADGVAETLRATGDAVERARYRCPAW